jgi:hypothetical protein
MKNGIFRARLVGFRYSQVPGVDFTENYAPVVNDITMRLKMVLMMLNKWDGEIINVETAFYMGNFKKKSVCLCQKYLKK